jgi:hypothetical protein
MERTENVLFIYNRYYQGRVEFGPTSSWELIWKNSLMAYFKSELDEFNPDIFGYEQSAISDDALDKQMSTNDYDLIVMIFHNGSGWTREFISSQMLFKIKSGKSKLVAIWGDIQIPEQRKLIKRLSKFVDLNVVTASHAAAQRFPKEIKMLYSWVPVLESYKDQSICDCDSKASFAGSIKHDRGKVIDYLRAKGIVLHLGGGEGRKALTRDEYLTIIAHPISIGFSGSRIEPLLNARTFEVLSQGSLLLEEFSRETPKFLIPYEDYVPWFSKRDLASKIIYYNNNTIERNKISKNGLKTYSKLTNDSLWDAIIAAVDQDFVDTSQLIRKRESFYSEFNWMRKAVLKLEDSLTSQRLFNPIYDGIVFVFRTISFRSRLKNFIRRRLPTLFILLKKLKMKYNRVV